MSDLTPDEARRQLLHALTVERFTPVTVALGRMRREAAEVEAEEALRKRHLRLITTNRRTA